MKMLNLTLIGALNTLVFFLQASAQDSPLDRWTVRKSGTTWQLLDVAYGNGFYVAVGGLPPFEPSGPIQASLLSSPDGITWTSLPLLTNANIYGVSFVNNQFIAVGDSGLILTSKDGLAWAMQSSSAQDRTTDIYPLGGVAFGNGTYVAMNRLLGNSCLVSTNATNWFTTELQPSSSAYIEANRVHFDEGMFVAAAIVNNAGVLTSTNGINWIQHSIPNVENGVNDYAFGGGRWVAVGDLATIVTSTDTLTWAKAKVPTDLVQANINFHGITYSSGVFVVVGDSGTILTSADGLNWISRTSPGTAALNAIVFGNGSLVTVGLSGAIWESAPILRLSIDWQREGANLTLSSPSGLHSVVQMSLDLTHWTNLFSIPTTQQTQTLLDTNALALPQRFYRAITQAQ